MAGGFRGWFDNLMRTSAVDRIQTLTQRRFVAFRALKWLSLFEPIGRRIGPRNERRTAFGHDERLRWGGLATWRRLFSSEWGAAGRQFVHVLCRVVHLREGY